MGRNITKRELLTAIGLSAWVASVLDLMVTIMPVMRSDAPLAPVLATGRGAIANPPQPAGVGAALVGVGAHVLLILMAAAIFVLAARKIPAVAARPVAFALLYGVALFFLMPDHGEPPAGALDITLAVLRHVLCFGLPFGLITARMLLAAAVRAEPSAEP